jgi:hypothetical protein
VIRSPATDLCTFISGVDAWILRFAQNDRGGRPLVHGALLRVSYHRRTTKE